MSVVKDGVVRIPKSVFETAPAPAADAGSSSNAPAAEGARVEKRVKRLDGSYDIVPVGLPPKNPAFQPRQTVWESKVVTNDKLEVKLKFHERKGLALTPELEAKKAELQAAGAYDEPKPAGGGAAIWGNGKGKKGKKGKGKQGGEQPAGQGRKGAAQKQNAPDGPFARLGATPAASAAAVDTAPKADPEAVAKFKNRPKGGVKILGGAEGAVVGDKRERE